VRSLSFGKVLSFFALAMGASSLNSSLGAPAVGPSSAFAAASTECPGDDAGLMLPPGFCASIFADGIGHARQMVVAPNGVLYVNTWSGRYYAPNEPKPEGGFLVALQDKNGSGKADVIERFGETAATGNAGGLGIALYNGSIYAESNDRIVRYTLPEGAIVPVGPPTTVVSGLPLTGDHPMHPFIITADGSLYIDVATATNACQLQNRTLRSPGADPCIEQETRGGVWRYDASKTGQKFSPAERYATGIRNAEGFGVDVSANLIYVTQHGRDQLHANWPDLYKPEQEATLPSEEVVLLKKGGDYGWPKCYYDPWQQKLMLAPEYGGDGHTVGLCAGKTGPVAAFPAHWGPNAMVFYDQKQFPTRYRNGLFIAFHGSWDRAPYPQGGYNVVFQSLAKGQSAPGCEIFADGFAGPVKSPGGALHRPSGVAVAADGSLYVSDDTAGRIYKITYVGGPQVNDAAAKITPCPSLTAPAGDVIQAVAKPPEGTHPDAGAAANLPVPPGATHETVALGAHLYHTTTCTGCHGGNAAGTPLGPNLTANKWLWSDGSVTGIAKTITMGVSMPKQYRSVMPAMGGAQLTAEQVSAIAAYLWALNQH
jgi:glucose/arabinose dehydrogenase/mono/diheme cytochrome c family protein